MTRQPRHAGSPLSSASHSRAVKPAPGPGEENQASLSDADQQHGAAELRVQIATLLPELRGYARFLARDRHAADDLVQDAVLRALGALDQFQPDTSLRAWIFTILRNVFYEQARHLRTERRVLEDVGQAGESMGVAFHITEQDQRQDLKDIEKLIWSLSPLLREALMLIGAHGMEYEEAARICGVSAGAMKVRVSRARRILSQAAEYGVSEND
ncbi:sigma-70 family RNA polymerase sigma factor [Granulibacter bethesdensis]|uniref:RNA polymerase sigma factor n=1 Tax=Granulibacter bethesdensis (strain ATCC BAA-1260 / CGDNIH1) TaxID=391165 RepID=Q0BU50_GRABC|nr:sigma-70 family RNA polymerase sigma factor [Granulibacter bethesdensis]ABI61652.1 RNA polymerase ECF-type sigma factor [Granulibacter bethesdensis CGDNIH1]AHJ69530.1 RNA polymerase ECF-type sigma factor [Granulibacter bethesdensis]APH51457.1 RNA polymerase ECF-type sigma factor [Granulibacter bethesdensis]APH64150.1 RNA polymerase ECF-type sigma factor [Granulibacter bethesdensis]